MAPEPILKPVQIPAKSSAKSAVAAPHTFAEQLAVVPLANRHVATDALPDGGATVTVEQRYPSWLLPLVPVFGLRSHRRYQLDPIAWSLLRGADGSHSLATDVAAISTTYRLSFHEARVLVLSCLALLMQRGLVVLATPGPRASNAADAAQNTTSSPAAPSAADGQRTDGNGPGAAG